MSLSDMAAWDKEFGGLPPPPPRGGTGRSPPACAPAQLTADAKETIRLALHHVEKMRSCERSPDLNRQRLDAVRAELDRLP